VNKSIRPVRGTALPTASSTRKTTESDGSGDVSQLLEKERAVLVSLGEPRPVKTKVICDVFVSSPLAVDPIAFDLWLLGFSATQAAQERMPSGECPAHMEDLIRRDTEDLFANFALLKASLQRPALAQFSATYPVSPALHRTLVNKYYGLEAPIVLRILSRRLKLKQRKKPHTLTTIAQQLNYAVQLCHRQFCNLQRVNTFVQDITNAPSTDLSERIAQEFHLAPDLAAQYNQVIFLDHHRFNLQHKLLSNANLYDFTLSASVMLANWCPPGKHVVLGSRMELLKELKSAASGNKNFIEWYLSETTIQLKQMNLASASISRLSERFSTIANGLFHVASILSQPKNFRDFFSDVVERLVLPLRLCSLSRTEAGKFFESLEVAFFPAVSGSLSTFKPTRRPQVEAAWLSFLHVISAVTVHFLFSARV